MITSLAILKAAREWLTNPKHWTKGTYCRDKWGKPHYLPTGPLVGSTCAIGALMRTGAPSVSLLTAKAALDCVIPKGSTVAGFNDCTETTHADVLALFDRAIEKEKACEL